eukprot:Pompholyxophrys_sp_v1_NODE_101_length_1989_cov_2.279214.p4 type:complete len:116 gc:universal NODE_101_length_1989_cov_2.279214:1622-1275(-)
MRRRGVMEWHYCYQLDQYERRNQEDVARYIDDRYLLHNAMQLCRHCLPGLLQHHVQGGAVPWLDDFLLLPSAMRCLHLYWLGLFLHRDQEEVVPCLRDYLLQLGAMQFRHYYSVD